MGAGGQGTITWSAFPSTGQVGTSTASLAAPVSSPVGADFTYTASGGCTISSSRVITFNTVVDCAISVRATQTGYAPEVRSFVISGVTKGAQTDAPTGSNVYGQSPALVVGGTLAVATAPTGGSAETSLEYESQDTARCTVASNGIVTGVALGQCRVRVRWASDRDWNASGWLDLIDITVGKGTIVVSSWGSYSTVEVGRRQDAPAITVTRPSGVTKRYSWGGGCLGSVLTQTNTQGQVEGRGEGTCIVRLTLSKTGYNNIHHDYTVTVERRSQSDLVVGSWNPYRCQPQSGRNRHHSKQYQRTDGTGCLGVPGTPC